MIRTLKGETIMAYEVLRAEKVGAETIKLIEKDNRYRVLIDSPRGGVHFPALAVRWTFRTAEVARLAFEFCLATDRCGNAITNGQPARPNSTRR
jgi:hypothetical protein